MSNECYCGHRGKCEVCIPEGVDERVKPFIHVARQIIKHSDYHQPTWVIGGQVGTLGVIQTPFRDNVDKEGIIEYIKRKLTKEQADFYIFIHEAYMLKTTKEKYNPDLPVKEQKGIDCLIINYQNREGFYKMWIYPIIKKGKVRYTGKPEISDNREKGTEHGGRMVINGW